MFKKLLSTILLLSFILLSFPAGHLNAESTSTVKLEPYIELYNKNLSTMDLRNEQTLLSTLSFSSKTVWPSPDKLLDGFDPLKILEYGKNPGLGLGKLHEMGYTGKGVHVAYIDQPLLPGHVEYKNSNVRYYKIRPDSGLMGTSMHGPAVLSLLAGKQTGVAPDSKVYFFGHPAWLADQTTHAEALRKLIEVNRTLPAEDKVRIVGFSDAADVKEKNVEEFNKAIKEAEDSGIMVFLVTTMNIVPISIKPYKDKNDPSNYEIVNWASRMSVTSNTLFVPSGGVTTAVGSASDPKEYMYWTNAGLSWTVPYIVGTIALGMQIDPTLTKENAIKYLKESAYPFRVGGIINPEGFLKLVAKNCAGSKCTNLAGEPDYAYVLYNSKWIDASDLAAIKSYCSSFGRMKQMVLKDVADYADARQIYKALKEDFLKRPGSLKGVQIIGTASDVPAFNIHFKIQMQDSIDDSGFFKSDFFYSNFKNEEAVLQNDFSIYKNFNEKLNVSFTAEWPVMRLPLTKGEIAGFIEKYNSYAESIEKMDSIPLVNFSSPIFKSTNHSDDMGLFIKERLDKEFGILSSSQYKLYGNKQGLYPVTTEVSGDFTKINIKSENEKGIADFFINSHGQENNIDQVVFEKSDNGVITEKRISFLNNKDINQVLSGNYYTLTTWTCLNAYGLGNNNLLHEVLANGKCVNAIGASSIISNNGVNVKASLENMKKNNFYYFQYAFFKNLMSGFGRSESFYLAQKAYAAEILKNMNKLGEGNYQFNLHNLLSNHNLGLLENWNGKYGGLVRMDGNNSGGSANETTKGNLNFNTDIYDTSIKVNSIGYERIGDLTEFSIDLDSGNERSYCLFDPPDGSSIKLNVQNGIKKGNNIIKLKILNERLKDLQSLTFNVYNGSNNNWISFSTDQLGL